MCLTEIHPFGLDVSVVKMASPERRFAAPHGKFTNPTFLFRPLNILGRINYGCDKKEK